VPLTRDGKRQVQDARRKFSTMLRSMKEAVLRSIQRRGLEGRMGFSWRLLLLLGALTVPTCGYANPSFDYAISGPMVFRNGFNGGNCNGCEWIIAEGTIQPDTPDVFKKFLLRKKVSGGISVKFNSPGGSLLAGVRLGEMIRAAGLFSEVGKTIGEESSFDPETIEEKTRAEGICASACVYAFIGGKTRFAEKSKIGIHQSALILCALRRWKFRQTRLKRCRQLWR
jgi:hypothetical protein